MHWWWMRHLIKEKDYCDETLRRLILLIREREDEYAKLTREEEEAYERGRERDSEAQKKEG